MKHSLSRPAIAASVAYLAVAAILAASKGYGGFLLGMPWTSAVCLSGSDRALNSIVAGSIIANALIVYLVVAAFLRLKARRSLTARKQAGVFLLTKSQFFVFATVAIVFTSPFLALTICGIEDEENSSLDTPLVSGNAMGAALFLASI